MQSIDIALIKAIKLEKIARSKEYEVWMHNADLVLSGYYSICDHKLSDGSSAMNQLGDQCTICLEGPDHQ